MIIGFTGTSDGLTEPQKTTLFEIMTMLNVVLSSTKEPYGEKPIRGIHGDCIGGDATFHASCMTLEIPVGIYPGHDAEKKSPKRARCDMMECSSFGVCIDVARSAPYLERNDLIAQMSDLLLVCPKERDEQQRSGTWVTYRYAKKHGTPVVVVFPEGDFEVR